MTVVDDRFGKLSHFSDKLDPEQTDSIRERILRMMNLGLLGPEPGKSHPGTKKAKSHEWRKRQRKIAAASRRRNRGQ